MKTKKTSYMTALDHKEFIKPPLSFRKNSSFNIEERDDRRTWKNYGK